MMYIAVDWEEEHSVSHDEKNDLRYKERLVIVHVSL